MNKNTKTPLKEKKKVEKITKKQVIKVEKERS